MIIFFSWMEGISILLGGYGTKAVSNRICIWEPKPKIGFQHNTYSLQQSTYTENPFWVSGEA